MAVLDNGPLPVVLVTQMPSDAWIEGLAVRPNGRVLTARLDQPEVYSFQAEDSDAVPELLCSFPGSNGIMNLCPLKGRHDEYAVLSATINMAKSHFSNFVVWRLALKPGPDAPAPEPVKMATIPGAGSILSLTAATERVLLLADSGKHCIWQLDIETGESSVLISDDSMKIKSAGDFFGLNRMRVADGFIVFTNTSAGTICKVPFGHESPDRLRTLGPVEIAANDVVDCDGWAMTNDNRTFYLANYMDGFLWKLDVDPVSAKATTTVVMSDLVSPTAVEVVDVNGQLKLFVVCCGQIDVGWVKERISWSDINAAVQVTVTTTTEEVVGPV
ncbi:hypothetical protein PG993_001431 [Apiospora rasikravindrae]|uniref:SMP-30/Gluconolactonase/LRE-like region domain-containing protein n=1 Tax=Apiospora rasikravindrae TaxID=990691 RepID=A0ABR1UBC8_9PEZI